MNKEKIDLIQCDLVLIYIKNKDYSTYYRRKTDSMVVDNEILDNEDNLYLTTLNKYNKLQEENKQLKEDIKQYQRELEKADSITQSCIFQGEEESGISFRNCLNKMTDYKTRIDKAKERLQDYDLTYEKDKVVCEVFEILRGDNNE